MEKFIMSGLFGVVSTGNCAQDLFYGTDYHSHMGTEYGGLAVLGEEFSRQIHNISQSQFKSKFYEDYSKMLGNKGIGVISDFDEQPIYLNSKFGPFCVVTAGFIENKDKIANILLKKGISFSEVGKAGINAPELIAKLINTGETLTDGIEKMFEAIEGSCSLLLLNKDGVYAARDRLGYTPLVIGQKNNSWAVTSETAAFANLEFKTVKYINPGEIVLLTETELIEKKEANNTSQTCTFLWVYTGFPASDYENINTEIVRENSGRLLAKKDKDIEVDIVAGVPDSGTGHALGYAIESGKPYKRALVKYTSGYGRSYTPPSQATRDLIATMKLIPIKEIIKNNRIILCEDSIVRGTQLKNFTVKKLWDCGAKEIHVRPACPPLMFPCKFCLSTRNINELATRKAIKALEGSDIEDISKYLDENSEEHKNMIEWIQKDIAVTSLRFQSLQDTIKAVGLPKENLCTYCWDGTCPH
jgi:amidophosphoribosyltransferase